jgi:hypothetical protein
VVQSQHQENSSTDPISKKTHHKKGLAEAQGGGPEFKPWYHKKEKEKRKK